MSTPTRHDASKVLMGSVGSSDRVITAHDSDPASFPAGLAVKNNGGPLSLTTGELIGVSLGKSLSDTKKTAVVRAGDRAPLILSGYAYLTKDELTFYTKVNSPVSIEFVDDDADAGSEVVTVTTENEGDPDEYKLISVNMDVLSTATECKAALDASAEALALIDTVITGTAGNAQAAFVEDEIDGVIPVIGAAVHVSATTGKAIPTGGTTTGALYVSEVLTGIQEDASEIPAAVIDMVGGL